MKTDVANFLIHDIKNRYPLREDNIVDGEIIDVLIDRWSNQKYVAPRATMRLNHPPTHNHLYLM